jgi:cobalt-zinc-cadmium efflux system protein
MKHPSASAHEHHAHGATTPAATLTLAVALTLAFAVVEALAGWWSGSLALLGDAGHMLTDAAALLIAALAARIALLPPSPRHSFGMARVELVAAFVNAAFMLAIVAMLVVEGISRLVHPVEVKGLTVTVVAGAGLALNLVVAWMLSRGARDLNMRAALLHVLGDVLGSVAALVSGVVVMLTGWTRVDPVLTFVIAVLIGFSSVRLAREALHGLMEGVPFHLSLPEIGKAMAEVPGVMSVHDLHVWSISGERVALSAHVVLGGMEQWSAVLPSLRALLQTRFGIGHVTLQPETAEPAVQPLIRHGARARTPGSG